MQFSGEQLRVLENLAVAYGGWLETARAVPEGKPWLVWKKVGGYEYLYEKRNRDGTASSLGRRSEETERIHAAYRKRMDQRQEHQERAKSLLRAIAEQARIYRSLKLPMIDPTAGAVLREADIRGMLGANLIVVGTNTMAAYEVEAQTRFASGLDATLDFDLAWSGATTQVAVAGEFKAPIMELLKAVDETFVTNTERPFQALNANAYEVEILCAPSVFGHYPPTETLRPTPLPEQEWLLRGRPVNQVVCDRTSMPVRIVAPDPRWMALHKLWLSDKPLRNRKKTQKDRGQGEALLKAISHHMPHYNLDEDFRKEVPHELQPYLPRA